MRMWNVEPRKMCRQHLLGEHFEIHKLIGNLKHSGRWANSLTVKGFLEPQNALKRHTKLVREMDRRGFNHKSPLNTDGVKLLQGEVDVSKSIRDLKKKCEECRRNLK